MTLNALHPTKSSLKNHNPKKNYGIFAFFAALFALRTLSPEGTAEGGTRWEPLANATQARMDTYPIRIETGLDTYQNALFL